LKKEQEISDKPCEKRTRVAAASFGGALVNMHLGEAKRVYIFEQQPGGYRFVEIRDTPPKGGGADRWNELAANTLADCCAILVEGIGDNPTKVLQSHGIRIVEMSGTVKAGLDAVYLGTPVDSAVHNCETCTMGCCALKSKEVKS